MADDEQGLDHKGFHTRILMIDNTVDLEENVTTLKHVKDLFTYANISLVEGLVPGLVTSERT